MKRSTSARWSARNLLVRICSTGSLRKSLHAVAVLAFLLVACSEDKSTQPPVDEVAEIQIRKVTQRFGIGPWGIDPNQIQFWVFRHDVTGRVIKSEFHHGGIGQEQNTIYDDYFYQDDRLSRIDHYIFYDNQFVNSRIETYEYDDEARVSTIKSQNWSEITDTWSEGVTKFVYGDQDRLIELIRQGSDRFVYFYDENGNAWKQERWPLFEVDYEGPITTTFTFDDKKNPFYRPLVRFWLPMGNGNPAPLLLSPNNIVRWDGYSPQTGGVIASGAWDYEYNAAGYPAFSLETVTSPLTDPEPGIILWETEYEYLE